MIKLIFIVSIFFLTSCSNSTKKENKFSDKNEYYILRGINYSQNKDYKNAIREFEVVYRRDKKNIMTMRELAYCYIETDGKDKAIEIYNEILKYDEKDEISLKNLSYLYYEKNDFVTSRHYLFLIPSDRNDIFMYKMRGYLYFEEKNYKASYEELSNALLINNEYDDILYERIITLLKVLNKKDELYQMLEKNYRVYNKNRDYIVLYSNTMVQEFKEIEKAKISIKRYLIDNYNDTEMLLLLIELEINLGNYEKSNELLGFVKEEYKHNEKYLRIVDTLNNNKLR